MYTTRIEYSIRNNMTARNNLGTCPSYYVIGNDTTFSDHLDSTIHNDGRIGTSTRKHFLDPAVVQPYRICNTTIVNKLRTAIINSCRN